MVPVCKYLMYCNEQTNHTELKVANSVPVLVWYSKHYSEIYVQSEKYYSYILLETNKW